MTSDRPATHEVWCDKHDKKFTVYTRAGDVVVYENGCLCVRTVEKKA